MNPTAPIDGFTPMAAGFTKKLSNPLGWSTRLARWERDTLVVDTAGFNDKTLAGFDGPPA